MGYDIVLYIFMLLFFFFFVYTKEAKPQSSNVKGILGQ